MAQDWFSINHLKEGTCSQQRAYQVLSELDVLNVLKQFNATLTGTFPLGIDIPGSDLDICCEAHSLPALSTACEQHYGSQKGFNLQIKEIAEEPTLLVRFFYKGLMIEIFGQATAVIEQSAFRHMLAEHSLLTQYGEPLRKKVLELKKAGLKTEPAFAKVLGLEGNPYQSLLRFCP